MKTADDYKVEDAINNIRYNRKLDDATKHTKINEIINALKAYNLI